MRAGHLDEARTLLAASVHLDRGAEPSIQGITFALVALARLAQAEGEPEAAVTALGGAAALRQRSGSATWPSMRRDEAELAASLEADLGAERYRRAFARGADMTRREALYRLAALDQQQHASPHGRA